MKVFNTKGARGINAVICIICMLLFFCVGTVTIYAQDTAKITASSCEVKKGEEAAVSFELSGNPGIWGLKFRVIYNHDVLTLESVKVGDVFEEGEVTLPESFDREKFVFYASRYELENISENGTLITLNFVTNAEADGGEYAVEVELVQVINVDGDDVSMNATDGIITIVESEQPEEPEEPEKPEEPEEPEESEEEIVLDEETQKLLDKINRDKVEKRWKGNAGWMFVYGEWYYFDAEGKLKLGWILDVDNKWYYMSNNGSMHTGWLQSEESGLWYYLDPKGGTCL